MALLKDPEIRARIEKPLPMPDVSDLPPEGVAPGAPVVGDIAAEPGEPT